MKTTLYLHKDVIDFFRAHGSGPSVFERLLANQARRHACNIPPPSRPQGNRFGYSIRLPDEVVITCKECGNWSRFIEDLVLEWLI